MPGLSMTHDEFVTEISMSDIPYILLEGPQDRNFFDILLQSIQSKSGRPSTSRPAVEISTAEALKSDENVQGNREKVEKISEIVGKKPFRNRFVGFVDREFREFKLAGKIADDLAKQHRVGRLVWSRGHSIENYLFDFEIFQEPLFDCSTNGEVARVALERLRDNFSTILNIACALGLAAHKMQQLSVVRRTVRYTLLKSSGASLKWDIDKWRIELTGRGNIALPTIIELIRQFEHWLNVTQASDPDDVRWSCDGHLGMRLIWEAYAKFVYDVSRSQDGVRPNARNQRSSLLGVNENAKLNHLARNWSRRSPSNGEDTPRICFDLVGIKR